MVAVEAGARFLYTLRLGATKELRGVSFSKKIPANTQK